MLVASGGGDLINNSGLISGEDGIFFDGNVATETVENSVGSSKAGYFSTTFRGRRPRSTTREPSRVPGL